MSVKYRVFFHIMMHKQMLLESVLVDIVIRLAVRTFDCFLLAVHQCNQFVKPFTDFRYYLFYFTHIVSLLVLHIFQNILDLLQLFSMFLKSILINCSDMPKV